jgi:hypothetical protein
MYHCASPMLPKKEKENAKKMYTQQTTNKRSNT